MWLGDRYRRHLAAADAVDLLRRDHPLNVRQWDWQSFENQTQQASCVVIAGLHHCEPLPSSSRLASALRPASCSGEIMFHSRTSWRTGPSRRGDVAGVCRTLGLRVVLGVVRFCDPTMVSCVTILLFAESCHDSQVRSSSHAMRTAPPTTPVVSRS